MKQEQFQLLLEKYLHGTATEAERRAVENWYAAVAPPEPVSPPTPEAYAQMEQTIWQHLSEKVEPASSTRAWPNALKWIALGLLIALLGGWWYYKRHRTVQEVNPPAPIVSPTAVAWQSQRNQGEKVLPIVLSDGSVVRLAAGATLHYPVTFEGQAQRPVRLEGSAFFEVAHDSARPFLVEAGGVMTQVLGTSFWVKMKPDRTVRVVVRTGKVKVYSPKRQTESVVLLPNHQARYEPVQHTLLAEVTEQPLPLIIESETKDTLFTKKIDFNFKKTNIAQVLFTMEQVYGVQIALYNPDLANRDFTGDLRGHTFQQQMHLICRPLRATYRADGMRYIIE